MLIQTLDNLVLFARMRHKMLENDPTIDKSLHVELLLEDRHHEHVLFC